jgi:phospholipid/cholesterol/gamma-HCH transport system substrate-binding protein
MAGARTRSNGMSPFKTGLIALVVLVFAVYFGFTKANPFANPFEYKAMFASANNLKVNSPVRIAGVDVGKVKKVEPVADGSGAALVTMEMEKKGLPIHKDAELKVRPRIFLEGNFFVDVKPGSPSEPEIEDGDVIPSNQTATPVQFGQILTALQSDTRHDLQILLKEYSKGLNGGGAEAFNRSTQYWEPAYKNSSLANEATLGQRPHDLSKLMRGQAKTFRALATNEQALKDLVTDFNTTAAAFAREDVALEQTIPALRDLLRAANPALRSLNASFPSLRAFAREALPGVRSSGPTIDASLPLVRQARRLVSERELKGLSRDLRATVPSLVRLNRATIPFLAENRVLSACQNEVLLPFARTVAPDPEFPENSKPFYKQAAQSLVGLAGESRLADAATPLFHAQFMGGPTTVINDIAGLGTVFGQAGFPVEGTRPANPSGNKRPPFRPDIPCETQESPDLNAPRGGADQSSTPDLPVPDLPDLPTLDEIIDIIEGVIPATAAEEAGLKTRDDQIEWRQVLEHLQRQKEGKPSVDPLTYDDRGEQLQARKLGMRFDKDGALVKAGDR